MADPKGDAEKHAAEMRRLRILPPGEAEQAVIRVDRREALRAWERLGKLPFREQAARVESDPDMQSWALAALLCDVSAEAAADGRAMDALQVAKVALRVAGLAHEEASWRLRLEGYACGHLANALRALGELSDAEEGFRQAERFWLDGAVSHPGPLDSARVLRLEALLRFAQRRLKEALELLDRADTIAHEGEKLTVQVQTGAFLGAADRWSEAVKELQRAMQGLAAGHPPRLRLDAAFNLTVSLIHADLPAEAGKSLAGLRKLAAHGTDVDRTRVRWQEARCKKSLPLFAEVRSALAAHGLPYDAALATFEEAALHAGQGDAGKVRELARGLAPLAASESVPREAQATIKIFCRLAEKDGGLAPERTRRFADDFRRTAGDPSLRLEPWPVRAE